MFYTSFSETHISFVLTDQLDLLYRQFLETKRSSTIIKLRSAKSPISYSKRKAIASK